MSHCILDFLRDLSLKEAYGEVEGLILITYRHKGLERAIVMVYPNSHNCLFKHLCVIMYACVQL